MGLWNTLGPGNKLIMQLSKNALGLIEAKEGLEKPAEKLLALPEKVLQFGTGVLLRALPDYFIDKANKQKYDAPSYKVREARKFRRAGYAPPAIPDFLHRRYSVPPTALFPTPGTCLISLRRTSVAPGTVTTFCH